MALLNPGGAIAQSRRNRCSILPVEAISHSGVRIPEPIPVQKEICPILDPFKETIDKWLQEDKNAPRKQRHTAKRVYDRLVEEVPGFNCSIRTVSSYVKVRKEELNLKKPEGYIPLIHYPGESQGDFGAAQFFENGI